MKKIQDHIRTKLNDEQYAAAMHVDTSSLIIAWAGSGKTRALTYKIAYLMYGLKIKPQSILAVTFTNKAANEMKERILKLWKEMNEIEVTETKATEPKELKTNWSEDSIMWFLDTIEQTTVKAKYASAIELQPNDLKWIGTFHSVFLKILKEDIDNAKEVLDKIFGPHKYNKNFTILDANDSKSIIKDVLKKLNLKDVFKPNECKWVISKLKNEATTPDMFLEGKWMSSDQDQNMWKVYKEYQKVLALSNALDFDDLLFFPYIIFSRKADILKKRKTKFKYIMVDEAQDTNWIQFDLMKMLSWVDWNITLIGDDYQSIYGRRWAIMENFLNVKKHRPNMQMYKLQTNYRSRPHIVAAWSHIIKKNENQYEKTIVAHRKWDDKIVVFSHRDEMDEAANIVDLIKKMKNDKIDSRNEVAILYRTNAQSSSFEQILVQEGIPYKIHGAYKFFERKEIKDIISYLVYILNPESSVSLKRIINIPARKIGKTTIANLEEYAMLHNMSLNEVMLKSEWLWVKITPQAKKWITEFHQVIHSVTSIMDQISPSEVIDKLVKNMRYKEYLIKEEGSESKAEERYDNIWQLINMAGKYVDNGIETLRQFMEEVALLSDVVENEKWDIDAVKLMTLHASKWLEFPIVFIAWCEDQVFPLSGSLMEPKLLEEERRLMYVGITRAENHLFLSYAHSRMQRWQTKMNPPSRFIDELPPELLKKYDLAGGGTDNEVAPTVSEWDTVRHKLFGTGYVLEIRQKLAIVKFHNPKFWVRKIEMRFLEVM